MANKSAIITGASRGIGRGISLELAQIGYDLVINYAGNKEAADKTVEDCKKAAQLAGHSVSAIAVKADVGEAKDRDHLIDSARKEFGRLDLLVNNAGITSIGRSDILEAKEENFDQLMSINLKGPFFLTQQAANWMIDLTKQGTIESPKVVTISSISAYTVSVNRADYCMAKAALGMMTKLYAVRLAEHGIRVYEICPGIIASDMTAPVQAKYDKLIAEGLTPMPRWGQPQDIGKTITALAQDYLPFSTGEVINVDGGFHLRQL
jgi:3-oxoacyl-[acyl-carrier protein] reductase